MTRKARSRVNKSQSQETCNFPHRNKIEETRPQYKDPEDGYEDITEAKNKGEREFSEEENYEAKFYWMHQVDDFIEQDPFWEGRNHYLLSLHPDKLKKFLEEQEQRGNFEPRNLSHYEWEEILHRKTYGEFRIIKKRNGKIQLKTQQELLADKELWKKNEEWLNQRKQELLAIQQMYFELEREQQQQTEIEYEDEYEEMKKKKYEEKLMYKEKDESEDEIENEYEDESDNEYEDEYEEMKKKKYEEKITYTREEDECEYEKEEEYKKMKKKEYEEKVAYKEEDDKVEKQFSEEEMEEGRCRLRQIDDYLSQNPTERKREEWMIRLHPDDLRKLLEDEEKWGRFKPRNWTEEEWIREIKYKERMVYTREDDECDEDEYEDEYEEDDENEYEEKGAYTEDDECDEEEYEDEDKEEKPPLCLAASRYLNNNSTFNTLPTTIFGEDHKQQHQQWLNQQQLHQQQQDQQWWRQQQH